MSESTEPIAMRMQVAIENVIRWHYYSEQRGEDTADPSYCGLNCNLLEALESFCCPETLSVLREQGAFWAHVSLGQNKPLPWDEAFSKWIGDAMNVRAVMGELPSIIVDGGGGGA